jgi:hypothetical protein
VNVPSLTLDQLVLVRIQVRQLPDFCECPDELVRVFVVANEIHHAGSLELHHKERLARVINDLERAVSRKRR